MVRAQPVGDSGGADRLARVVDMVNNAVALLQQAMDEIKAERGHGEDDDGNASSSPVGNPEQPG